MTQTRRKSKHRKIISDVMMVLGVFLILCGASENLELWHAVMSIGGLLLVSIFWPAS